MTRLSQTATVDKLPTPTSEGAVKVVEGFIPEGQRNRPGEKLDELRFITIHDTGNTQRGADALSHERYLRGPQAASPADDSHLTSWHYTVDDKEARQHLPLDESGFHAGDGARGPGNATSIGIEICENSGGDRTKAEENAARLTAQLLKGHGLTPDAVVQHNKWSGKDCPRVIRGRPDGWGQFMAMTTKFYNDPTVPPIGIVSPATGADRTISGLRILVNPQSLQGLASGLERGATDLRFIQGRLSGSLKSLDWEVRRQADIEGRGGNACRQAEALAGRSEESARWLEAKIRAFVEADGQGATSIGTVAKRYVLALPPALAHAKAEDYAGWTAFVHSSLGTLKEILKPIDWIADHPAAVKAFRTGMTGVGRFLNEATHERGHIKTMTRMGDSILDGAPALAKCLSALGWIELLNVVRRFYANEITFGQMAHDGVHITVDLAIGAVIPIPFVGGMVSNPIADRVADWAFANMPPQYRSVRREDVL